MFQYSDPIDYLLEAVGIIAAVGSGVALALVNLVMGRFINVLSGANIADGLPSGYMNQVEKYSWVTFEER